MIFLIALSCFAISSCYLGSRLVATLFALELGANPFQVGMLAGLYAAFSLLLAIYSGQLADRLGPRRPMIIGAALTAVSLAIAWGIATMPALYVAASLAGAAFIFYNVAVQNMVALLSDGPERARNFSILSQSYSASSALAPLAAGFCVQYAGHRASFLGFAVLAATATAGLIALRRLAAVRNPDAARAGAGRWTDLLRDRRLRSTFVTSGLVVTGWDLYTFYFPVYGHEVGMSPAAIGLVLALFGAAAFVVRGFLPPLVRRYSEPGLLARSMTASAVLFVAFPLFADHWVLGMLSVALGLTLGLGQPLSMMITYARSPKGRAGETNGVRLMVNHTTHFAVPIVSGALGTVLGVGPVFWLTAVLLASTSRLLRASPQR